MIYASCDTFIAQATDGTQLFAKNSDRDPNEAHQIIYVDRQDFKEVNCIIFKKSIYRINSLCAALWCELHLYFDSASEIYQRSTALQASVDLVSQSRSRGCHRQLTFPLGEQRWA